MNSDKTEVLLISSSRLSQQTRLSTINLNDIDTNISAYARNIGVIFDSYRSMDAHVAAICKRRYCQLRNLSNLRPFLTRKALAQFAHSFISSQLDFCNVVLIGLPDTLINKLQRIQNTAARIITGRVVGITLHLCSLIWTGFLCGSGYIIKCCYLCSNALMA